MSEKDKKIIDSYKKGKTPVDIINRSSKGGKIVSASKKFPIDDGITTTMYCISLENKKDTERVKKKIKEDSRKDKPRIPYGKINKNMKKDEKDL